MGSQKTIETSSSIMSWEDEENGIVYSLTKPNVIITIENLKENFEVNEKEFKHHNKKLLLEVTSFSGSSKETRDFLIGNEGIFNYVNALAILSQNKFNIGAIMSQLIIMLFALKKPTKMFYNKEEAVNWLKSIK